MLTSKTGLLMVLVAACIYIMMFVLNRNYPLFLDDFVYKFVYLTAERIESIGDIFESQYIHYFAHGGRTVVHCICQFLLMIDFFWACVLNTIAYLALVYMIYRIANKDNKINPAVFLLCHILIWFLQPGFCEAVLWKTGSANYLWGFLIVTLFVYPYYRYYRNRESTDNVIKSALFFIGGIIAGWTNENISISLIIYIIGSITLYRIEKTVVPKWSLSGLAGVIIGCIAMLAAPGNYERMSSIKEYMEQHGVSMSVLYISNIKYLLYYFAITILPLLITYIAGLFIYNRQRKSGTYGENSIYIIRSSMLFIVMGFTAFFVLLASPTNAARALFGTIILFIIPTLLIYANIDFKANKTFRTVNIMALVILLTLYLVDYNWKYKTIKISSDIWEERFTLMEEYKSKGIDTITFNKRIMIHPKYGIWDLNDSENKNCANYYGFKSMKTVDPNDY